ENNFLYAAFCFWVGLRTLFISGKAEGNDKAHDEKKQKIFFNAHSYFLKYTIMDKRCPLAPWHFFHVFYPLVPEVP
ncbi:MAG: hypothetical protein WBM07_14530, partial [Chitinivibrionales bacterium]